MSQPEADVGRTGQPDLLARVAQHAGIALIVCDLHEDDVTFAWVNEAFRTTTGYAPEEVLGQSLRTFFDYRWEAAAYRRIAVLVGEREHVDLSLPFRDKRGRAMWFRVSIQALGPVGEEVAQWVCTATDVTREVEQNVSQLASLEFERATHADLVALSTVSDILGDADHPGVLGELSSLLSRTLVHWAGFLLLENGLRFATGIDATRAMPGRGRSGATWPRAGTDGGRKDQVRELLEGRIEGPIVFDLRVQRTPDSAEARVQAELRAHLVDPDLHVVALYTLPGSKQTLGLMAVVSRREDRLGFDGRDVTMLNVVARRVGMAVENVRLYALEHQLAETLQLAMLPEQADIKGLDVWTYYSPNSRHAQVGGDWYDVLQITPELVGVVIGDVVGHDVEAAAIMGQLRSIVRSYAFEVGAPGPVLDRVDKLLHGMRVARAASLIYSTLERTPQGWVYEYSRAGHLPPLLVRSGRVTQLVDGGGSLIGFGSRERVSGRQELRAGDVLILYTDGLIERRDRHLRAGLEQLTQVASSLGASDAAGIGEELLATLADGPEDDVAILVVRIPVRGSIPAALGSNPRNRRWTLPSEPASISRARHAVLQTCEAWHLPGAANAELVVSELLANAVLHGWGHVVLRLFDTGEGLRIEVEDSNPSPPVATQGHANGIGGYGMAIVEQLADWGWRPAATGKVVWAKVRERGR